MNSYFSCWLLKILDITSYCSMHIDSLDARIFVILSYVENFGKALCPNCLFFSFSYLIWTILESWYSSLYPTLLELLVPQRNTKYEVLPDILLVIGLVDFYQRCKALEAFIQELQRKTHIAYDKYVSSFGMAHCLKWQLTLKALVHDLPKTDLDGNICF